MENEMIERAARRLCEDDDEPWNEIPEAEEGDGPFGHICRDRYRRNARTVITAMREPTEAMRDVGFIFAEGDSAPAASHNIAEAWHRMIDAALTPPTNS